MPSKTRSILAELRALRRERFAELAQVPAERMNAMTEWARKPHNVRFVLLHIADHDEEHAMHLEGLLSTAGFRQTTAQRLLGAAEATRGELFGALVGLDDADLDLAPPGEWPLRRTLNHIINSETSYLVNTSYAVERFQAGLPWERPPAGMLPPELDALPDDSLDEIIGRMVAIREEVLDRLAGIPDDALNAPTVWAGHDVNVDFRLLRFSNHEREHCAHIVKWRGQVDRRPTEAQYLLGLAWAQRGVLQGQLVGLDDSFVERPLDPASPDVTVRGLLLHIAGSEAYLLGQVRKAE